jgi:hypothetical protein
MAGPPDLFRNHPHRGEIVGAARRNSGMSLDLRQIRYFVAVIRKPSSAAWNFFPAIDDSLSKHCAAQLVRR